MRVERMHLRRAPGFPDGFQLGELAPGVNLVIGPNASGKSTFCRAVRASLWSEEAFQGASVEVEWRSGAGRMTSERTGARSPSWSDAGGEVDPPRRPDGHLRRCFGLELEELLTGGDETEAAIARDLRLELSDGQDTALVLREARALTFKSAETARGSYETAQERLSAVKNSQNELAEDEQRLAELQRELDESRAARHELRAFQAALELVQARARLTELERQGESFPAGMDRVPEDAPELAAERGRQADAAAATLRAALDELGELQLQLDGYDLDAEEVAVLADAPLAERSERLAARERERDTAAKALAASERALGEGAPVAREPVGAEVLDRLEALLEREQALVSQRDELRARVHVKGDDGGASTAQRSPRGAWVALALGVIALTVLASVGSVPTGLRLGGVALAIGLLVLGALAGLRALPGWAVRERAAARREEARRAEAELERVEQKLVDAGRERGEVLVELGLERELGALSAVVLARRLAELEAVASRVDGERAAHARLERGLAEELERAAALARAHRRPEPRDAAEARATLSALERDREASARQRALVPRHETRVERAREELARAERVREELFVSLGLEPGDEGGLQARANRRGEWLELRATRAALEQLVAEKGRGLEGREDLAELDQEALEQGIARHNAQSEKLDDLQREVSGIEARCDVATQRRELEQARKELDVARDELAQKRDELVFGELAEFLMSDVAASHRREAQPALVRRAGEHLGRFTAARYTLEVAPDADLQALPLRVREDGAALELTQLSSGTRAQLRIALRIAVAEAAEEGDEPLPIFLDEALANSDAERFDAIAAALGDLAQAGRQVFYLTADADEVQRFEEALLSAGFEPPCVIRLGPEVQRARASTSLPARARREPPALQGHDEASYLRALGLPRLDGYAPAEAAHLAWLLGDELEALQRMLAEGVETVERARQVLARGWSNAWDAAERERFELRARALGVFLASWRIGRGRALDEVAVYESPLARSKSKIDGAVELARELDWDAEALVEALRTRGRDRDERVRGLQTRFIDEAVEEWTEHGQYDPNEALDRVACLDEVAGALEGELREGTTSLGELEGLIERWWGVLEPASEPDRPPAPE